jgi:hypothetical protein
MTRRLRLFPVVLLALSAGCTPTSGESARSDDSTEPVAVGDPDFVADNAAANATGVADLPANNSVDYSPSATPAVDSSLTDQDDAELLAAARDASARPGLLDLPPSDAAADAPPFPDEVTSFMVDRDGCDHFRGEEPYDTERRAFLQENITELCTGTDARLAQLRRRYADDPDVIAALGNYEDRIESPATP